MFRVVEDANGQTKIFLNATNEFLCVVNEKVCRKRPQTEDVDDHECPQENSESRLSGNASKKLKNDRLVSATAETLANENTAASLPSDPDVSEGHNEPPTQAESLALCNLAPSNDTKKGHRNPLLDLDSLATCIPITCLRMREYLHCLKSADTTSAIENYEKYCSLRFLLRTPSFNGFPVVYREPKWKTWHTYCFTKEQRRERRRYLETGLNRRARRLRAKCKPAVVELRKLTDAEISMWQHGRLNRLSLESVPCLQPRCVVPDVRELVCNGFVSQVSLSDEACAKLNVPKSPLRRRSLTVSPRRPAVGKENMCNGDWQSVCHTSTVVNGHQMDGSVF